MQTGLVKALIEQACWRHIGVWGKEQHRCEKLETVRHCRNCEIFSEAAKTVFQRESSEQDLFERSLDLYHSTDFDPGIADISVLPFRIGKSWFCVYPKDVVSIAQQSVVHGIPNRPTNFVKGLVAVDGGIYTAVAIESLLGESEHANGNNQATTPQGVFSRTIILQAGRKRLAINVNEVRNVVQYNSQEVSDPPSNISRQLKPYIEKQYMFDEFLNETMYQLNLEPVEQEYYKALV